MSLVRNISWTFASRMGAQFTQILFSVFIARLVTPQEYGLIGMLTVLSGFAFIVGEGGLNSALIYMGKSDQEVLSTAFWLQFFVNLFFTLLFYFGAGLISDFYNAPSLAPVTQLMSVIFVLQSVGQIQQARLTQEMNFKAIAIANYVGALVSSICALVLALAGYGVWALVWQALSNALAILICTSISTRWIPRMQFSMTVAKKLTDYSAYLLLHNSLNYWMRNGDNLLIGKVLGTYSLGIYNRAYTLMLLPLTNIGSILGQVMFPTLSRARDNLDEFRRLYENCIRMIALVSFPLMGGMSVLAQPILLMLYGKQWADSAPILQILSLVGLFQCIIFPVGWVFTSLGKTKEQARLSFILVPLFFVLVGGGLHWGLLGVTWGYAIWAVISGILNISVAGRLIGVSVFDYLALVMRKVVATVAMMAGVAMVHGSLMTGMLGEIGMLAVRVVLGAVLYFLVLLVLRDQDLGMVLSRARTILSEKLRSRSLRGSV